MNNINIVGRVVKQPEIKQTQGGVMASFSVAVRRQFKDKQTGQNETDFFNCKAFGKTAEIIGQYVKAKEFIAVQGSIQFGKFTNQQGQEIKTTDLIVSNISLINGGGGQQQPQQQPVQNQQYQQQQQPQQYQQPVQNTNRAQAVNNWQQQPQQPMQQPMQQPVQNQQYQQHGVFQQPVQNKPNGYNNQVANAFGQGTIEISEDDLPF